MIILPLPALRERVGGNFVIFERMPPKGGTTNATAQTMSDRLTANAANTVGLPVTTQFD